jgi:ATP-dependent DNA ligase
MQTFTFKSSSSDKEYTTILTDEGKLTCSCIGWTSKRNGKPRHCKHTKDVAGTRRIEVRGEYVFLVGPSDHAVELPEKSPISSQNPVPAKTEISDYLEPMLASAMPEGKTVRDYKGWLCELKYDGIRCTVRKTGTTISAWSRPRAGSKQGLSRSLPLHIVQDLQRFPDGYYDGELVGETDDQKSYDVARLDGTSKQRLVLFDILESVGNSTRHLPQTERRGMLDMIFDRLDPDHVRVARIYKPVSQKTVEMIWAGGGEGVILKNPTATYRPAWRSPDWVKVKNVGHAAGVITGFDKGENGPYSRVVIRTDKGHMTRCKAPDQAHLRLFEAKPDAWIGKRVVFTHYGETAEKFRGPIIWDHECGESE